MRKTLKDGQRGEVGATAPRAEVGDPFGPPKSPSIPELAKRGRRYRGEKAIRDALREALRDLFDAYLYTLTHPCGVSPHEVLALIHAHREVLDAYFATIETEEMRRKASAEWEALKSALRTGLDGADRA